MFRFVELIDGTYRLSIRSSKSSESNGLQLSVDKRLKEIELDESIPEKGNGFMVQFPISRTTETKMNPGREVKIDSDEQDGTERKR